MYSETCAEQPPRLSYSLNLRVFIEDAYMHDYGALELYREVRPGKHKLFKMKKHYPQFTDKETEAQSN